MSLLLVAALCAVQARPVDRYAAAYGTAPGGDVGLLPQGRPNPPEGPYAGNGDVTVLYSGNVSSASPPPPRGDAVQSWQQWLYLSKNDMWGSDVASYYPHLSAGRVGFLVSPAGAGPTANASVTMYPGNASIVAALTSGSASVVGTTRVLENNAVVTTLTCTSANGAPCDVTLLLSDTDANLYGMTQATGAAPDGSVVWWRKENLHAALNAAYVGPCNPLLPLQSTERAFTVDASGNVGMVNGSCLWSDEAAAPGVVTVGACTAPQGAWVWKGTQSAGDIVHSASSACLAVSSKGDLMLGACGSTPWAQVAVDGGVFINATSGAATGCIVAVPDNNNNTLGVALGVADASGNLVNGTIAAVVPGNPSAGITLSLSLESGAEYALLVGVQTLRDIGCAGVRPQWENCTTSPQDAAAALVRSMAVTAARAAAEQASADFWIAYWNASSVDITAGATSNASAQLAVVERFYYFMQYLQAVTTRDGKVTPALDGFVCTEPVAWKDQFTVDYNLEAQFWGAGSSNHLAFIHPVMASTTNPGAVATARIRAQSPLTWGTTTPWPGVVGHTVAAAQCAPDNCPNLTTTGFKGTEWPSAAMPLGDGRLAADDLNTRWIGALLSTNLIQYWEYSRNMTTLAAVIYPFVRDNAEFYRSYAVTGTDGKLMFPYSCAQEACQCIDGGFVKTPVVPVPNYTTACLTPDSPFEDRCPDASGWEKNHPCLECYPYIATGSDDGYHNAFSDIAFSSYTFRNAVRFASLLGVDADLAVLWQAALDAEPPYPGADFTFVQGAKGSEFNGGAGYFVEAEYGHHPGVLPANSTVTPVVWPWCNTANPLGTFSAMWPTDEIGVTQTTDAGLLARAKQTVFAINNYQASPWANTNGFCLSWPPAVRVSGREDAVTLVDKFSTAIPATTVHNACVRNKGGMLENIAATIAINDMLMQSHGGVLRFFPVWNATALGAASFTTLRAYGAFLVSASVDSTGTVSPVVLFSDVGESVVFESPWDGGATTPTVTNQNGATVPVVTVSPGVFSFHTDAGNTYTITA